VGQVKSTILKCDVQNIKISKSKIQHIALDLRQNFLSYNKQSIH